MTGRRPPKALIFAITITGILNNTMLGPSLPDVLDEFGRSASAAGPLVAAGSLPGIIVAPIIGLAADRFGRRLVLVPCLMTFGAFGLSAAVAPTYGWMLAARVLQGFGSAGLINLAVVLISDHWDGHERTRLIGKNAAVLTLALAVAPATSGAIADAVGWRAALAVYGLGLPVAAMVAVVLEPDRPSAVGSMVDQLRDARVALRAPEIRATLLTGTLVFVLIFGAFLTVFPLHLEEVFGLSASRRGLLIAVPAASSSLVAMNLGRIRARVPIRALLLFAGCTYVAAFAGIWSATSVGFIVAACILYGLGEGVFIPSLQDVVAEAAPPSQRGAVIAVWVGAARLGQTAGPLLAAATLWVTDTRGAFGFATAGALLLGLVQLAGPVGRPRNPATAGVADDAGR